MLDTVHDRAFPVGAAVRGHFADPSIVVHDSRYWLVPTTDGSEDWQSTRFSIFSSSDLVDWVDHGVVLDLERDVRWASERAWAPMLVVRDGRWYLYYSANDNIGVAVARRPTGPYVDIGEPLIADGTFSGRAIDPSVFEDDDGTHWLLWGNGVAHMVPLGPDLVSIDPSRVVDLDLEGFREAPWLHRHGDTYTMSWSENDTRDAEYRVRSASSPSLHGPWADSTVLLEQDPAAGVFATGHHSILRVPHSDDWLIAYHRFAIPDGDGFHREVVVQRLEHDDDGRPLPVVPNTRPFRHELRAGRTDRTRTERRER